MSIRIETKKVVPGSGIASREIVTIDMLGYSDLPRLYRDSEDTDAVWKTGSFVFSSQNGHLMKEGNIYGEVEFNRQINIIRQAGEHLRRVNEELRKLRKDWTGEETFVI